MLSSLVERLVEQIKPLIHELAKFVVVGGVCFVLDLVLAYLFRFEVGLGPTTSKALSTILATAVSYAGNRLWSFSHRVDEDRGQGQDVLAYGGIAVIGLVITLIPVDAAHYLLGETSPLAFTLSGVLGTGVATVFRFWADSSWNHLEAKSRTPRQPRMTGPAPSRSARSRADRNQRETSPPGCARTSSSSSGTRGRSSWTRPCPDRCRGRTPTSPAPARCTSRVTSRRSRSPATS